MHRTCGHASIELVLSPYAPSPLWMSNEMVTSKSLKGACPQRVLYQVYQPGSVNHPRNLQCSLYRYLVVVDHQVWYLVLHWNSS